ncbi:hypothetical protein WH87_17795 [Devosia epidermidihirudinis]|uniref:HTH gntR-type domain-containing protein n=1 Tax=Devosia epidermidihirudinis TaxID=1293439 RepID=A0A0F5Q4M4_9HYPH|nr:GntR family transcriptional regulator [Devosia epidermidihirudinis]KKC35024.1 hypothetical protein WH87_17795 [Devosia epidermidihirudinis]
MEEQQHDNVGYQKFRDALEAGRLKPGMVITQNELCDMLGMSLSPLRETLVLLEEFGLVEIKPRAGIKIVYPEVAFIRENFQFRIMIEVHAMRTFVHTATDAWIDDMLKRHLACKAFIESGADFETVKRQVVDLDKQLHRSLVDVLNNGAITAMHERLQDNLLMARRVHQRVINRHQLLETVDEHLRILESLRHRDLDGAIANLEAHFRASTHRTFTS